MYLIATLHLPDNNDLIFIIFTHFPISRTPDGKQMPEMKKNQWNTIIDYIFRMFENY